MKIRLARSAGFCMGVRRALDMTLKSSQGKSGQLLTLGPLIHNPQVISFLERRGIHALGDGEKVQKGSRVIIRAHGISPRKARRLEKQGVSILDATCPRVKAVQRIIDRQAAKGSRVVIVGDREHPEVVGLLGHARNRGVVIRTEEEAAQVPLDDGSVCVVAQTTMDETRFRNIVERLRQRIPDCHVHNTICSSTHERQQEVRELASEVEAMIVVGGKNSANTRRLAEISEAIGVPTFHVETDEELDFDRLKNFKVVGLTAGASTPNWMIQKVIGRLRQINGRWGSAIKAKLFRLLQGVVLTNFYVGIGAASLTLVNCLLMGVTPRVAYLVLSGMYVFSIHLLNRYAEDVGNEFNDPLRAEFYVRHARLLLPMGVMGLMVGILAGLYVGVKAFILILFASFVGTMYTVPIFPSGWRWFPYQKIKDIPSSKTISVALAWGVVTALLPALEAGMHLAPGPLIVLIFSMSMVFVRSAQLDLLDIQGDRILGKETLPVLLGEEKTRRWMSLCLVAACLILAAAVFANAVTSLGWLVILSGLYPLFYLRIRPQESLMESATCEGIVDAHFLIMGAIALIWWAATPA